MARVQFSSDSRARIASRVAPSPKSHACSLSPSSLSAAAISLLSPPPPFILAESAPVYLFGGLLSFRCSLRAIANCFPSRPSLGRAVVHFFLLRRTRECSSIGHSSPIERWTRVE